MIRYALICIEKGKVIRAYPFESRETAIRQLDASLYGLEFGKQRGSRMAHTFTLWDMDTQEEVKGSENV